MPEITNRDVFGYLLEKRYFYTAAMLVAEVIKIIRLIESWESRDPVRLGALKQESMASFDEMLHVCEPPLNDSKVLLQRFEESKDPRDFSVWLALELTEQSIPDIEF